MLDKDWLSTCAPIGVLDPTTHAWIVLGAGVFIYDDPFIWYATAHHLILNKVDSPLHILVNHAKTNQYLVNVESLHKEHKINWLVDPDNDIALTLFPADPNFMLKAIGFTSFLSSKDMIPSMPCYSVGCPYSLAGFDIEKVNPCVLDGIISGIDSKKNRIYVTVPTFPGNSGGPLFVWKQPNQTNGGASLGESVVFLGGIISQYVLVGNKTAEGDQIRLPSLHLGVVKPSEAIQDILRTSKAIDIKNKISKAQ